MRLKCAHTVRLFNLVCSIVIVSRWLLVIMAFVLVIILPTLAHSPILLCVLAHYPFVQKCFAPKLSANYFLRCFLCMLA